MLEELDHELKQATLRVAQRALAQFGSDDIYGFSLYTSGEFLYLLDSLFTESGLDIVTRQYFDKYDWFRVEHRTFEKGKRELRWSPCDSPYHLFAEEEFSRSAELLDAFRSPIFADNNPSEQQYESMCRAIEVCMLRSLVNLRQSAILPDSTVLCLMMGDQSEEIRLACAEILNPPATVVRFRNQLIDIDEKVLEFERRQIPDYLHLPKIEV